MKPLRLGFRSLSAILLALPALVHAQVFPDTWTPMEGQNYGGGYFSGLFAHDGQLLTQYSTTENVTNNQVCSINCTFKIASGTPSALIYVDSNAVYGASPNYQPATGTIIQAYALTPSGGGEGQGGQYIGSAPLSSGSGVVTIPVSGSVVANYRDASTGETRIELRLCRPPADGGSPRVMWGIEQFVVLPAIVPNRVGDLNDFSQPSLVNSLFAVDGSYVTQTTANEATTNNQVSWFYGYYNVPMDSPGAILHAVSGTTVNGGILQAYALHAPDSGDYLGYSSLANGQGAVDFPISPDQLSNQRDAASGDLLIKLRMFLPPATSTDPNSTPITWNTDQLVVYAMPSAGPALPTNLQATNDADGSIDLSWTDNSDNETDFLIERKGGASSDFVQVGTLPTNSVGFPNVVEFKDTSNVSASTTYTYRVRAVNSVAAPTNKYSPYSNEASVTTTTGNGGGSGPGSGSGMGIVVPYVVATSPTKISIYWQGVSGAVGYNIYRSVTSGGGYQKINIAPVSPTDNAPGVINGYLYSDEGLTTGTTYYYVMTPVNGDGSEGTVGPEHNDTPNGSAIPWDGNDPNAILAKCDQIAIGGWVAGAPSSAIGPDGVGYVRYQLGESAFIEPSSPLSTSNGAFQIDGQDVPDTPDKQTTNYVFGGEGSWITENPGTGPFRKVTSKQGYTFMSAAISLPAPTTPASLNAGVYLDSAATSGDAAFIYSGGEYGDCAIDAGFRYDNNRLPGWVPQIFMSGPNPNYNPLLPENGNPYSPLYNPSRIQTYARPIGENNFLKMIATGPVHLQFCLPDLLVRVKAVALVIDTNSTGGHMGWYRNPSAPNGGTWAEVPSTDPKFGYKNFVQILQSTNVFEPGNLNHFLVKRVDSIGQTLYKKDVAESRPMGNGPDGPVIKGLFKTGSFLKGVNWSGVMAAGPFVGGGDFDYTAVGHAGSFPYTTALSQSYCWWQTTNPWFEDLTFWIKTNKDTP